MVHPFVDVVTDPGVLIIRRKPFSGSVGLIVPFSVVVEAGVIGSVGAEGVKGGEDNRQC